MLGGDSKQVTAIMMTTTMTLAFMQVMTRTRKMMKAIMMMVMLTM